MDHHNERWEVNYKHVTMHMSDGSTVSGKINIRNFNRVSDFLKTAADRFIIITPDGSQKATMLNRGHVIWAEETED